MLPFSEEQQKVYTIKLALWANGIDFPPPILALTSFSSPIHSANGSKPTASPNAFCQRALSCITGRPEETRNV
jgi:hypothetical protein